MNQRTPTLLYIDDDGALARLVDRGLTRRGYKVLHAASGEEGLELIRRAGTTGGIDVVALDQYMPGLDGLETLEQIMAIPGAPPVVFVTASQDSSIAVTALKAGAADYLVKDVKRATSSPCFTSRPRARCARPNCRRRARRPKPRSMPRATATQRWPPNANCCCARSTTASATRSRSSPRCCIYRQAPPRRTRSRRR
ncbi:CheY-like chemotaxis protein [Bradyrhizobium sp. LB9.1b]